MNKWDDIFSKRNHAGFKKVQKKLIELGFKKNFKIFNVVGTNGKGTLSKYLSDSYQASGKKVGTFTSPHIYMANERIKINNIQISDTDFFSMINGLDNFSFFETLYIVAMLYFQNKNIDIAIIEAGIGGKKDTTKAIEGDYGLVTSIGIDHTEILGNTLIDIAINKSGIRNDNMLFYVPTHLNKEVKNVFKTGNYKEINNDGKEYKERNKKFALGIIKDLNLMPSISDPIGRTEVRRVNNKNAIIDVAHNEQGIIESILYLNIHNILFEDVILTISKNKNIEKLKDILNNKNVMVYQLDESYHSAVSLNLPEIKDLKYHYNNQNKNTLYIGTFRTMDQYE